MITLQEAIALALDNCQVIGIENISFSESLGRILAEDVFSDIDVPSFNKSAMDGYALRKEDINYPLNVIKTVQAGDEPPHEILPKQCVKIMTGAKLPNNADYVAKVEDTKLDENGQVLILHKDNKSNIRYKAEDIKKGECILKKSILIRPQEIATLATVGKTTVAVYKKPSISIASTGNELVEPNQIPKDYQIRNSNAFQLISQCKKLFLEPSYEGIIPDDITSTKQKLQDITYKSDITILTGGVSMGDYDFVPAAIQQLGFNIIFQSIAVQPGKPTMMAIKDKKLIFGLPGNPVSSFIQFELIVKPVLYKIMGHQYQPFEFIAPLANPYHRKKSERTSLVPVKLENNKVVPVNYHGSAHLFALNDAIGFIQIPSGITKLESETYVTVRLF